MFGSHKKIKIIAVALCVVLVAGVVLNQVGLWQTASATSTWTGVMPEADEKAVYGGGSGTTNAPYLIASAEDLAQMSANVNEGYHSDKVFKLTTDISLNGNPWTPIGKNDVLSFHGTFYGDNHTITGLYSSVTGNYQGLFGYVGSTAGSASVIRDLTVSGTLDISGGMVGGITGYCLNTQIVNCTVVGNIAGSNYVGGIVGWGTRNSLVLNCSISKDSTQIKATGSYGVGGIAGQLTNNCEMLNCCNYAPIISDGKDVNSYAGGLVGYMEDSKITNSYNAGTVSASKYAGGIVNGARNVVMNCYNKGTVSVEGEGARAASIAAFVGAGTTTLRNVFYTSSEIAAVTADYKTSVGVAGNIGVASSYADPVVKSTEFPDAEWNVNGTLLAALNKFVSDNADTYKDKGIYEWQELGYNNEGYPILTTVLGHQHDKKDVRVTIEPTCTQKGRADYYCTQCGNFVESGDLEALGHDYQESDYTKPSCTETGLSVMTCTRCRDSYSTVIPALGHDFQPVHTDPTCTEQGYDGMQCSRCDVTTGDAVYTPANGHSYPKDEEGNYIYEVKSPTCVDDGSTYHICTVCGNVEVNTTTAALGHDWDALVWEDSTCIELGGWVHYCKRGCGTKEIVSGDSAYAAHKYEITQETDPNCTQAGHTDYECSVCHQTARDLYEGDYKAPLGHNYISEVIDPTCTTTGYTHHKCTRCNSEYDDATVSKLAHKFDNKTEEVLALCEKDGYAVYVCSMCNTATNTVVYPKIGEHIMEYRADLSKEPTCLENETEVYVCKRVGCGKTEEKELTGTSLGHDMVDEVVPPTCVDSGYTIHKCTRGDYREEDTYVRPEGHNLVSTVIEPTTTSMGKTITYCSRNDDVPHEESNLIAATPDAKFNPLTKELTLVTGAAILDVESGGDMMRFSVDRGATWITTDAAVVVLSQEAVDALMNQSTVRYIEPTGSAAEIGAATRANLADPDSGSIIEVVRVGMGTEGRPIRDSYEQDIEVEIAASPTWSTAVRPNAEGGTGSIDNVNDNMQYRSENDEEWKDVSEGSISIENLEPGTYYIRMKATTTALESEEIMVIIEPYQAPLPSEEVPDSEEPEESEEPGESEEPVESAGPVQPSANPVQSSANPPASALPSITPAGSAAPDPSQTAKASQAPSVRPSAKASTSASAKASASKSPSSTSSNSGTDANKNGSSGNAGASNAANTSNSGSGGSSGGASGSSGSAGSSAGTGSSGTSGSNGGSSDGSGGSSDGVLLNPIYYDAKGNRLRTAQTGDRADMALWILAAGLSVTAVAIVMTRKRKQEEEIEE